MPATMHRMKKKVTRIGKHNAVQNGSTREFEDITPERAKSWVEKIKLLRSKGYNIPLPAVHFDTNGKPVKPFTEGDGINLIDPSTGEKILWRSDLNLGFVLDAEIDADGDFSIELEAPGDPDDPNTPAGKLGTTIKETSIGVARKYTTGDGEVIEDCPIHVAACVHAIEANQKNFIPQEEGQFSMFSMSTLMNDLPGNTGESAYGTETSEGANSCDPKEVVNLLRKFAIDLPEDTSQDNFIERLGLALRQKLADEKDQEEDITPKPPKAAPPNPQPKDSKEKSGVVTMSTETNTQVQDDTFALMTMSMMTEQKKLTLEERLAKLVGKVISKEKAESLFKSEIDLFTMSQDDFDKETKKFRKSKLEFGIECLEAVVTSLQKNGNETITMSGEITSGYNSQHDIEHALGDLVNPAEDDEPLADNDPFMQVALTGSMTE